MSVLKQRKRAARWVFPPWLLAVAIHSPGLEMREPFLVVLGVLDEDSWFLLRQRSAIQLDVRSCKPDQLILQAPGIEPAMVGSNDE